MTATERKWAERVQEWKASGATAEEYARGRDFTVSTLRWWSSQIGRDERVRMVPVVTRASSSAATSEMGAALLRRREAQQSSLLDSAEPGLGRGKGVRELGVFAA